MADSDDEYDRKRRDKFRGERGADAAPYSSRGTERGAVRSARDDWQERDVWSRPRPRDYPGRVRDRGYSPSIEPAMKRPRTDYYGGGGDYFGFTASAYHQAAHRREMAANQLAAGDSGSGQPPMLSFKAFLATQDDNISDSEAIEKYNDYKLEFQRQQLNEFFVAHKDDEWFRTKYHPEDSAKRKEEQTNFIKKRVEVFMDLLKGGRLSTSVDCVHTNALMKLLDTVVIKLEGGNDEDVAALDKEYEEKEEPRLKEKEEKKVDKPESETKVIPETENKDSTNEDGEDGEVDFEDKKEEKNKSGDDDANKSKQELNGEDAIAPENKEHPGVGEKSNEDKGKESGRHSDSEEDNEKQGSSEVGNNIEGVEKMDVGGKEQSDKELKDVVEKKEKENEEKDKKKEPIKVIKEKKRKRSRSYSGSSSSSSTSGGGGSSSGIDSDSDDGKDKAKDKDVAAGEQEKEKEKESRAAGGKTDGGNGGEKDADSATQAKSGENDKDSDDDKSNVVRIRDEEDKEEERKEDKKPPPLHKTTSIFLRSLAPSITRQEVEAMCARYAGFLRVALADPQPERRWQRRGWVTFRRDANIKEICWALNNARLRDCDLGAIMNRDLSRRIRPVGGVAAHRSVVRTDIRVAARVAVHMDGKHGLWKKPDEDQDEGALQKEKEEEKFTPFGFLSHNPVLHNITDHLIEEASAEEDLLLGLEPSGGDDAGSADGSTVQVERDDALIRVLDRIVLYLRIVHSIDYYNHCEYPNEDEMPSRCGILHARGPAPAARADVSHLVGAQAEARMANFLPEVAGAGDVLAQAGARAAPPDGRRTAGGNEYKLIALAVKDVDAEIDKFVQANTRELAKDKWLCPLSGKKFKGPDFVRKHIFNKHAEKIEEVRKEVEFFNNYLRDAKRPAAADQQPQQPQQQLASKRDELPASSALGAYHPPPRSYGGYGGGGYMGGGGRYGGYGGGAYSRPHRGGYAHRARGGGAAAGGPTDYRPIIHYRDLDAPREPEEFI